VLIEKTIDLAKRVGDEREQMFIIAGVLVATDKFIDDEYSESIKEWLRMTKVARLYEEEKLEALAKASRLHEKEKMEAVSQAVANAAIQAEQARQDEKMSLLKTMLADGEDYLKIMRYTGFTKDEVKKAAAGLEI
jgi:thioredoxin-like negative regulator of GroEL